MTNQGKPSRGPNQDKTAGLFPTWFTASPYTHRIAVEILQHGPVSRVNLARRFDLTQGAVSRITNDLTHRGVIKASGPLSPFGRNIENESGGRNSSRIHARAGRPQQALSICQNAKTFIGINIHAGTALATAVNLTCDPLGKSHQQAINHQSPEEVVKALNSLVEACLVEIKEVALPPPSGLAIALGGQIANNRIVTYSPFLHWKEQFDLASQMESACNLPCLIFNDLDALALYEGWFGAGVGLERFALITIGSGIGYSLIEQGMPLNSPDEGYGLISHQLVDPKGPVCYQGHQGCAQCLTTGSLLEQYSLSIGHTVTLDQFTQDLNADMPQANTLLNLTGYRLGVLIASVANTTVPDKILVGGETAYLMRRCTESIRKGMAWLRHSQMTQVSIEIIDNDWLLWAQAPAARAIAHYLLGPLDPEEDLSMTRQAAKPSRSFL